MTAYQEASFRKYKSDLMASIEDNLIQARGNGSSEKLLLRTIPNLEENSKWYHPSTLLELSAIWSAINQHAESSYFLVGQAAFSSILIHCCSQEKHWGWVCDNVKPKKLILRNGLALFSTKLFEYDTCARICSRRLVISGEKGWHFRHTGSRGRLRRGFERLCRRNVRSGGNFTTLLQHDGLYQISKTLKFMARC